MRSDRVFEALHTLRNRYMLCQLASKATRKFHRPSTRIQETMNQVLDRIAGSERQAVLSEPENFAEAQRRGPALARIEHRLAQAGMALEDLREVVIHHPVDLRRRPAPLEPREHGQRLHDIAEGAWFDDEDFHCRRTNKGRNNGRTEFWTGLTGDGGLGNGQRKKSVSKRE